MTDNKIKLHNAVVNFCAEPHAAPFLQFAVAGQELQFPATKSHWPDGTVGLLTCDGAGSTDFTFWAYPDQRVRRAPEYDQKDGFVDLWGWTIQEDNGILRGFMAHAGIIPGKDGKVIDNETQPVEIDVPPEFYEFCEERGTTVEAVLRGFIADLCGLHNYIQLPREDGYSSHGSDERDMAQEYFDRTWRGRTFE